MDLKIKDKVRVLLERCPETRDNDNLLISDFWKAEMIYNKNEVLYTLNFLDLFARGDFTNPESIRRCRQKLQEENPALRGTNYKQRQKEQESVKKELKEWDEDKVRVFDKEALSGQLNLL